MAGVPQEREGNWGRGVVEFAILRSVFQALEQFVPGLTGAYTVVLLAVFLLLSARGELRYTALDIVVLVYFGLALPINVFLLDSSTATIANFNKLLLSIVILKMVDLSGVSMKPVVLRALVAITIALSGWLIIGSFSSANYVSAWSVAAYIGPFESTHLLASMISLLIASCFLLSRIVMSRATILGLFAVSSFLLYPLFMTGARAITFASLGLYFLHLQFFANRFGSRHRRVLVASWLAGIATLAWAYRDRLSGLLKFETLGVDGFSNGRDAIWDFYAERAQSADWINQILGLGVLATADDSTVGVGTHNDVLYLQLAFGAFGLVLFVAYLIQKLYSKANLMATLVLLGSVAFAGFFNGFIGYTELVAAVALAKVASTWVNVDSGSLVNPRDRKLQLMAMRDLDRGHSVRAVRKTSGQAKGRVS